jgi:hypothetical protein
MMRRRALILVAIWTCSCTAHQAHLAKRIGETTAAAALIGMLTTIVVAAADPGSDTQLLEGGTIFIPFAIGGALLYVAGDSAEPPEVVAAPAHSSSWEAAMSLAKEAKHAARRGDCAEVQAIEPRVRALDDEIYGRFENDQIIRTCLRERPRASGPRPQEEGDR